MIRVADLDDHPGCGRDYTRCSAPPEISRRSAMSPTTPSFGRSCPDVVVLDYHHPGRNRLTLCLKIKKKRAAPRVVLYTESLNEHTIVPAILAGADGIVSKASTAQTLLQVIRAVANGHRAIPDVEGQLMAKAATGSHPISTLCSRCGWPAPPPPRSSRRSGSRPLSSHAAPSR
jgi:DNA-binding NarL/FixJ family response regulator